MADYRNPDCTCKYLDQSCLACWKPAKHHGNDRGCKHCTREYIKLKKVVTGRYEKWQKKKKGG